MICDIKKGDAHFDDDENWTLEQTASRSGSRLLLVAAHELGHALGLGHSSDKQALMAAGHDEWEGKVRLSSDDIQAVQALYGGPGEARPQTGDPALSRGPGPNGPSQRQPGGPGLVPGGQGVSRLGPGVPQFPPGVLPGLQPGGPPLLPGPGGPPRHPGQAVLLPAPQQPRRLPAPTSRPAGPEYEEYEDYEDSEFLAKTDAIIENNVEEFADNDDVGESGELCSGSIDTILTMKNDESYVFKGSEYWKLAGSGVAPGYPRRTGRDWAGLPANLDAAFTWTNGKMYFFKGSQYWRFSRSKQLERGFPKKISEGFEGIPTNVDAAFVWGKNDKIYFFKGYEKIHNLFLSLLFSFMTERHCNK